MFTTRLILWLFYLLFLVTPLFFTPLNNELFEYNKMMLVYAITTIICGAWLIRMVQLKQFLLKRTPLDIPILLFLISQLLSTVFSIDPHTSVWGYYSRSNGGLLSIFSYTLLYYALISNLDKTEALKTMKAALVGGVLVSLWAIPEHFGFSLSCLLLRGELNASCWVQDVQARVFASLGQPNWLAAYLGMLIFPSLYFLLTSKDLLTKYFYLVATLFYYLAFTFAFSRGATLGVVGGVGVFIVTTLLIFYHGSLSFFATSAKKKKDQQEGTAVKPLKILIATLALFLGINILFGSALTNFKLINKSAPPARPGLPVPTVTAPPPSIGTQLENGGTESGQIRLIVWKGALDIFKKYPIFGSGVETFAYAYYNHRPKEHNLVSEWDFLYNKAHNEFLNYLSTTGLVGFGAYILLIVWFLVWAFKKILFDHKITHLQKLFIAAIVASLVMYHIQNFFGFSVVMIALFFFVFPAMAVLLGENTLHTMVIPQPVKGIALSLLHRSVFRKPSFTKVTVIILILLTVIVLMVLRRLWVADTLYKNGSEYADAGYPIRAYPYLYGAVVLNPGEPLYRSDLGFAAAGAAVTAIQQKEASKGAEFANESILETEKALAQSPYNVSLWRTAIRTYYQLSAIDPQFDEETIRVMDRTIALAPTDAKLYYNKGLILNQMESDPEKTSQRKKDAISAMEKAIELKPNYREARLSLGDFYFELGEKEKAIEQANIVLQQIPNDPDALERLEKYQAK